VFGETRTVSATASSGLAVTFSASGACQTVNSALGVVKASDVGECRVTAQQPGGPGVQAAAPVTQSAQIGKATPAITFSGARVEHPRQPFTIPLNASASGGATVQYRLQDDGYGDQLCTVQGGVLAIAQTSGLPRDCIVDAFVAGDAWFEPASVAATFTITPTVVKFTGHSDAVVQGSTATVTVTLNRVWGIEHQSTCGTTSASPESGASSYTVTVQLDATRPIPCTISVQTAQPDAATTIDQVEVQVS